MIAFLGEVADWFADSANWWGPNGFATRLWDHILISVLGIVIGGMFALPVAVWLGHVRRGGVIAVSAVNVGRAVPSFGIVALAFPFTLQLGLATPLGYWATLFALVALAMPPMFVNAYTGIREVDPSLVETARGMGMTEMHLLRRVEIPIGLPVIMAGVRTAAVQVVATATLGAVVGWGGLGRYIIDGFAQGNDVLVFVGGVSVAILAIGTDIGLGWVERRSDRTHRKRGKGTFDAMAETGHQFDEMVDTGHPV